MLEKNRLQAKSCLESGVKIFAIHDRQEINIKPMLGIFIESTKAHCIINNIRDL